MALQIDALPGPPSRNDSRDVFSNKANLFAAALPNFITQANLLAQDVEAKAESVDGVVDLTAADRLQTGADRDQVALDRAQVAEDKTAVEGSVATAAGHAATAESQAVIAQNSANSAAESAILAAAELSSKPIIQNTNAITQNQTIPAGRNALSVGPIAINDGVTVTVAPGSRWRIL